MKRMGYNNEDRYEKKGYHPNIEIISPKKKKKKTVCPHCVFVSSVKSNDKVEMR